MPARLQAAEDFVVDPEYFFCVLEKLVGDDEIDRVVVEGEFLLLDVNGEGVDVPRFQRLKIPLSEVNAVQNGLGVLFCNNHQIITAAAAQIDACFNAQAVDGFFENVPPVRFAVIDDRQSAG